MRFSSQSCRPPETELGRKQGRALSQPSSCRQGPRFRPSLNYNRRLRASQAHQLDGRPLLASSPSIFRTTAPTPFFPLYFKLPLYELSHVLQKLQRIFFPLYFLYYYHFDPESGLQQSRVTCELCRCTSTDWCTAEMNNQRRAESLQVFISNREQQVLALITSSSPTLRLKMFK